jgi:twitching motility protein PilU
MIDLKHIIDNFVAQKASDLFLTYGFPPSIKIEGKIFALSDVPMSDADLDTCFEELLTDEQRDDFESTMELNCSRVWGAASSQFSARLRINAYRQQLHKAFTIRRISTEIPTIGELLLPDLYKKLIMEKRGLILVVGQTGSGKSTSLASMIQHRNHHGYGHIITIEDPIEYVHAHHQCIISQRDVGIDTYSYGMALKNALRQTPDVILIGEIRDREIMEHSIAFAETGHLCVSTLHSNNAVQAIERVLNFFPIESHRQVLANLSFNLRGIVSQRLVENLQGTRTPVVEVVLNEGLITDLIHDGDIGSIKEVVEQNTHQGMQTFDQHLVKLFSEGIISDEVAIRESDSKTNVRLKIKQLQTGGRFDTINSNRTPDLAATPAGERTEF